MNGFLGSLIEKILHSHMESLALMVFFLFLLAVFSGPCAYASTFFAPKYVSAPLCLLALIVGVFWITLPISVIRFVSLPTIIFSIKGLQRK